MSFRSTLAYLEFIKLMFNNLVFDKIRNGGVHRCLLVRSLMMYMICHLSYTLQGHALFFRQIFLLMPQVNLVDSRVCVQTSSADTRYFSFDTLWSCRYSASNVCMNSDLTGNNDHVEALRVYLLSRSLSRLKNQFQAGNGMVSSHSSHPRCIFLPGLCVFLSYIFIFLSICPDYGGLH